MAAVEFARFSDRQRREYVASLGRSRSAADAARKADDDLARLLPDGAATPGHRFRVAEHDGRPVGTVWLGPSPDAAEEAWLYDIRIDEDRRGQGYGRAVMAALEDLARDAGASRLALNVLGDNRAAIALYVAAGYRVTAQQMVKRLDGG